MNPEVARIAEVLPDTTADWAPFWHRVDDPDGWVVSIYGDKLAAALYEAGLRLPEPPATGLDVERLARAIETQIAIDEQISVPMARRVAAHYARLSEQTK